MKYSYTFISKIFVFIICIFIFYPFVDKFLNNLLGIQRNLVGRNLIGRNLVEGFTWSRNTINKFNVYQDTVNLNANQYNMQVLQEQASEDEAKELLRTGYWPWSEDTKKQYIEGVWQNPIIKFQPEAALDYAMKLYNETAAKRLLSWNTKEGQFLLYGSSNTSSNALSNDNENSKKNIIKCSEDNNPILQKTTVNGYNLFNGFKNTKTVDLESKNIPNEMPGFSFVNGPCNPCSPLNDNPDYSCPFKLNVKGNDAISDVWKELWSI
jgi:hypothetical protein